MEMDELDLGPRKKLALTLARKLLKAAGITTAPVSLQRVVDYAKKDRKLTVVMDKMPERISGIMVKLGDLNEASVFIGVNADEPWCRRRYTLGHELGHLFMGHGGCISGNSHEEREAQIFSAELLIPSAMIKKDLQTSPHIPTLAKMYRVSEQALAIKLKDCRLV